MEGDAGGIALGNRQCGVTIANEIRTGSLSGCPIGTTSWPSPFTGIEFRVGHGILATC